jgi:2-polyprenyl-3-methyl-5-hydroxy-6-metoxy-1,4-benzoquinol methylase
MAKKMEEVICSLCQKDDTEIFYKLKSPDFKNETFDLRKCRHCSLLFISPRPNRKEIDRYYPDEKYYAYSQTEQETQIQHKSKFKKLISSIREATLTKYYTDRGGLPFYFKLKNEILALFGKHRFGAAPPNLKFGSILDVGCGDGYFLLYLKDLGWKTVGVEINSYAAQKAKDKGLMVYNDDLLNVDFGGRTFDVVRLWSVLEHLHQPSLTIKKISQILKRGGFLIIQTPNFNSLARKIFRDRWSAFDAPRHLYCFNQRTLKKLLKKNDFEILKIYTISVGTIRASIRYYHLTLAPFLFAFDLFLDALNLGDCLVCYAKKK